MKVRRKIVRRVVPDVDWLRFTASWVNKPGCAPNVEGGKSGTDAFPGGSTWWAEIPLGSVFESRNECAAMVNTLCGASPVARGLQARIALHGAWYGDGAGGLVHVLANNNPESSPS